MEESFPDLVLRLTTLHLVRSKDGREILIRNLQDLMIIFSIGKLEPHNARTD